MKMIVATFVLISLLLPSLTLAKQADYKKQLSFYVVKDSILFSKQDVRSAKIIKGNGNDYAVEIILTPQAAKQFSTLTASNIHRVMMTTIGNHIISHLKSAR